MDQDLNEVEDSPGLYPDMAGVFYDHPNSMKSPITIKFDLALDSQESICSIMQMVMDKIACLEQNVILESIELRLFALPPFWKEKTAQLHLYCLGQEVTAESNSLRWDNAFLNAFDKLCGEIYTK